MKVTILIDEYLPDTNQIVVRVCRMTSREPILNHKALAVDLDKLELHPHHAARRRVAQVERLVHVRALAEDASPAEHRAEVAWYELRGTSGTSYHLTTT